MAHESYELKAEAREQVGKGSARKVRREGLVPAVIYGEKKPPKAIALSYKEVYKKIQDGAFLTTLATIDVDGEKYRVLPKDYQLEPVRDFLIHVDFLRIGRNTVVTVNIPVHFVNEEESPGLERGGVLNIVRHEVEFTSPATSIPDYIEADLSGLEIGDSVHISGIKLPEGVEPTITDRDFTIATVAAPAVLTDAEEEGVEEGEEGEAEETEDEGGEAEETEDEGGDEK